MRCLVLTRLLSPITWILFPTLGQLACSKYHPDLEAKIKEEVEKLPRAKCIEPIQYLTRLAYIVLVEKKNGQIRVYIDFLDLNE